MVSGALQGQKTISGGTKQSGEPSGTWAMYRSNVLNLLRCPLIWPEWMALGCTVPRIIVPHISPISCLLMTSQKWQCKRCNDFHCTWPILDHLPLICPWNRWAHKHLAQLATFTASCLYTTRPVSYKRKKGNVWGNLMFLHWFYRQGNSLNTLAYINSVSYIPEVKCPFRRSKPAPG